MRLFHFTGEGVPELIASDGFFDETSSISWTLRFRDGVELSDSTETDARTDLNSCLAVLEIDEALIGEYQTWPPSSEVLRRALAKLNVGPHRRDWLVPAHILNQHAHVVDSGDFSSPAFAARYTS